MRRSRAVLLAALAVLIGACSGESASAPTVRVTAPATAPSTTVPSVATAPITSPPDTAPSVTTAPPTPPASDPPGTTPPGTTPAPTATTAVPEDAGGSGRYPAQPGDVSWPTVEWEIGEPSAVLDVAAIDAAVDTAFVRDDEPASVRSVVVVHGGRIVYERYHPLSSPDTVFDSFSVAKSATSTIAGMAVGEGLVALDEPTGLDEWADDDRAAITLEHLLHMASGLEWTESYQPGDDPVVMLGAARFSDVPIAKPLVAEPGTTFNYSTGTSAIVTEIVARALGGPEQLDDYIRSRLTDRLGMSSVELLTDESGLFAGGIGFDATTRDFARFGLLHLRGGVWEGERLLDDAWIDRVRRPSPAATEYGLHWWLDPGRDAFVARGLLGQVIAIVPDLDLVLAVNTAQGGEVGPLVEEVLDRFAAVS